MERENEVGKYAAWLWHATKKQHSVISFRADLIVVATRVVKLA